MTTVNNAENTEKPERTQLTLSISRENKETLQRIAKQKGMTMAGVLASWIADYE